MAINRGIDGSDPVRPQPVESLAGAHEERLRAPAALLATGTLACPLCDAPVALAAEHMLPADPLGCPYCRHTAAVRDFLSLEAPSRPARVEVRVVRRAPRVRA